MRTLFLLALIAVSAFASFRNVQEQLMRDLFEQWKITYETNYFTSSENEFRFNVFAKNYLAIHEHMAQDDSVTLVLNQFADLTSEEFGALYTGTFPQEGEGEIYTFQVGDFPASVDWRTQGAVTPVKNQGTCGSCWAFSATGALEGLYFINNTKLVSFSEQNFVDCVTADDGCDGGWPIDAMSYAAQNGVESEDDYPYVGQTKSCSFDKTKAYQVNSGYYNVTPKSLDQMKAAIVSQPVSVGVQANQVVFQFYGGGVIKTLCGDKIDHGVLVVGYEVVKSTEAFIVKNSWGAAWGNSGFLYIATTETANDGNGVCGILSMPAIPYKTA
jgi:KDEL-tailed cysteine endopeptidase